MGQILKSLRALADPTRLRILGVLEKGELSVQELQEITTLVQSRISTHLSLLQDAGLVQSRRDGRRVFYRLSTIGDASLSGSLGIALKAARELPESEADDVNRRRIVALRENQARLLFNQVAGRFDRSYGPGRSWQAFGQLLLRLLPAVEVADLGAGEGLLSELLALRCRRVIAVDNSDKIIAFGAAKARQAGLKNLEFRLGDLEDPPIDPASVDIVILSQALHHASHPPQALHSAHRILRPGGQVLILDLRRHAFEEARQLYGDRWLGFAESDLTGWLEQAGFREIEVSVVAREEQPPHFETILAAGSKPLSA
ncbi:MAG: metalloregulator ArsR/SmtB family transcription factor [Verrucomicrobiales bacterium]|nr:metalloregulator ArsR/SmtB family transcription factor [Verrucomicrobiales bacterium]